MVEVAEAFHFRSHKTKHMHATAMAEEIISIIWKFLFGEDEF